MEPCIIIGASHACAQLITSLRQAGWEHGITVIGAEPHLPYHRPPLSKTVLTGKTPFEKILLRPVAFYDKQNVSLRLGERVTKINQAEATVRLSSGELLAYSNLIISTGADPIILNLPGENLDGIGYLRSYDDVLGLLPLVKEGANAVIVGGGYIGLETAAALRDSNMQVTVLEGMDRVLQRVTGPRMSEFYFNAHSRRGVKIVTSAQVCGFSGQDNVEQVLCKDGSSYPADLVVIGVGVRPNTALAEAAGLSIENGIRVNEYSQTSAPGVYAVGDCTSFISAHSGDLTRLESVPNAIEQAKSAAAKICGRDKPYTARPWFWSDQFNLKLQIAGLNTGFEDILIRGEMDEERFSAWYYRGDELLAVDCVNSPADFMRAKKLLAEGRSPPREDVVNCASELK